MAVYMLAAATCLKHLSQHTACTPGMREGTSVLSDCHKLTLMPVINSRGTAVATENSIPLVNYSAHLSLY